MNMRPPYASLLLAVAISTAMGCTQFVVSDPSGQAAKAVQSRSAKLSGNDPFDGMQTLAVANNPAATPGDCGNTKTGNVYINDNGTKTEQVLIRVTGYGAPPKAFYPDPQRRLMAMRAAKIDAYRSMAERVKGVQIWGGTTIGDMVVEKDRFRVYLDTHLTGARVISENVSEDGTVETTVELNVGQDFLSGASLAAANPCKNQMPASAPRDLDGTGNHFIPVRSADGTASSETGSFYFQE